MNKGKILVILVLGVSGYFVFGEDNGGRVDFEERAEKSGDFSGENRPSRDMGDLSEEEINKMRECRENLEMEGCPEISERRR